MIDQIKKDHSSLLVTGLFLILSIWWVGLFLLGSKTGINNLIFGALYGTTVSLWGGVIGLGGARVWGGWRSVMGKATIVLSLGLLAQTFGQAAFSYYNLFLSVDIPYPSIADLGYFGSILLYIWGMLLLAKAAGVKFRLESASSQILAILVPLVILSISYYYFLLGYEFDWSQPLKIFLDFGYPLGQAFYVSLAMLVYGLSKKYLGGIMKEPIILIIVAFIAQFAADYNFLYQTSAGTWYNGGYGDYLYLISYFLMTMGLLQLKLAPDKIRKP